MLLVVQQPMWNKKDQFENKSIDDENGAHKMKWKRYTTFKRKKQQRNH